MYCDAKSKEREGGTRHVSDLHEINNAIGLDSDLDNMLILHSVVWGEGQSVINESR